MGKIGIRCQVCDGPVVKGRCKLCGMPYRNDEVLYHLNENRSDHYRHATPRARQEMREAQIPLGDKMASQAPRTAGTGMTRQAGKPEGEGKLRQASRPAGAGQTRQASKPAGAGQTRQAAKSADAGQLRQASRPAGTGQTRQASKPAGAGQTRQASGPEYTATTRNTAGTGKAARNVKQRSAASAAYEKEGRKNSQRTAAVSVLITIIIALAALLPTVIEYGRNTYMERVAAKLSQTSSQKAVPILNTYELSPKDGMVTVGTWCEPGDYEIYTENGSAVVTLYYGDSHSTAETVYLEPGSSYSLYLFKGDELEVTEAETRNSIVLMEQRGAE